MPKEKLVPEFPSLINVGMTEVAYAMIPSEHTPPDLIAVWFKMHREQIKDALAVVIHASDTIDQQEEEFTNRKIMES